MQSYLALDLSLLEKVCIDVESTLQRTQLFCQRQELV